MCLSLTVLLQLYLKDCMFTGLLCPHIMCEMCTGVTLTVLCSVWMRLIWLRYILLSIYLPISSFWCVQCSIETNRQRDSVERHGQYRGDLITHWKASFGQQVLSGCVVKGLLGGLTVLVEVEALVFCSTGKPQDKASRCLIPARLQNKSESCCFIKTTRRSVCRCLCARVCGVYVCAWVFFLAAVFILCQENDLFNIWWSGSQAVKTNVEMCCLELYFLCVLASSQSQNDF